MLLPFQCLDSFNQDLCIARVRQAFADLAKELVFLLVTIVVQARPNQFDQRAHKPDEERLAKLRVERLLHLHGKAHIGHRVRFHLGVLENFELFPTRKTSGHHNHRKETGVENIFPLIPELCANQAISQHPDRGKDDKPRCHASHWQ